MRKITMTASEGVLNISWKPTHPSILHRLFAVGSPRLASPPLSSSSGGSRGVPRPAERHSPSSVSWVFLGTFYQWNVQTPHQGGIRGGILVRCPNHLNWPASVQRSSGSTPSSSRMAELLTLSLKESSATLRRKLITAACTRNLVLLVTTQSSWP